VRLADNTEDSSRAGAASTCHFDETLLWITLGVVMVLSAASRGRITILSTRRAAGPHIISQGSCSSPVPEWERAFLLDPAMGFFRRISFMCWALRAVADIVPFIGVEAGAARVGG
jgi:hypothetical protein